MCDRRRYGLVRTTRQVGHKQQRCKPTRSRWEKQTRIIPDALYQRDTALFAKCTMTEPVMPVSAVYVALHFLCYCCLAARVLHRSRTSAKRAIGINSCWTRSDPSSHDEISRWPPARDRGRVSTSNAPSFAEYQVGTCCREYLPPRALLEPSIGTRTHIRRSIGDVQ